MARPPFGEYRGIALSLGIARLERRNALGGIGAPQSEKGITDPTAPDFIAAERTPAPDRVFVLTPPSPYH
jgi:hypothetical protein